jgi:hypothetical protein
VLGADHDDVLDPRDVRERDDQQRRGAQRRKQRGTRAGRILDAERGPPAA